ncbi:MAG TPA: hypothetical protein VKY24_16990 [Reyranella sp.]|nr:hypothetical protein [Reyranella sp.]
MSASSRSIAYRDNVVPHPLAFGPAGESDDDPGKRPRSDRYAVERDDLPYKVELWNEARTAVEQVLAVTANGSIGYAAYYAATSEHPDRYITLRHKNRIVSRWNESRH